LLSGRLGILRSTAGSGCPDQRDLEWSSEQNHVRDQR
jgi:hypothetical protein